MINIFKKYFKFIFEFNGNSSKSLEEYNSDINLFTKSYEDPLFFKSLFFNKHENSVNKYLQLNNNQLYIMDSVINKQKVIIKIVDYNDLIKLQVFLTVWLLITNNDFKIGFIFPSYNQSKDFIKEVYGLIDCIKDELKPKIFEHTNSSITLDNNSHIVCRSHRKIDENGMFRGITLDALIFNNCKKINNIENLYKMFMNIYELKYIILSNDVSTNNNFLITYPESINWFNSMFLNKEFKSIYLN